MAFKLDLTCIKIKWFTKFQINMSKHVGEKCGKLWRTDGRTETRTDGHDHTIIRPVWRRAYKNCWQWIISLHLDSWCNIPSGKFHLNPCNNVGGVEKVKITCVKLLSVKENYSSKLCRTWITCTSRILVEHLYKASFKFMEECRRK